MGEQNCENGVIHEILNIFVVIVLHLIFYSNKELHITNDNMIVQISGKICELM